MNCDRRCIFSVVFAEASWLSYQVVSAHRLVCRGSNCDRPGLVWPECSKVWCCYVWISWVEGQMVSVSYSKSPPPTPNPAGLHLLFGNHVFAEHWCCFVGVYSLQHFTQQSVEIRGQKPLNPAEWGVLCKKKNNNSVADSHQFMRSFGEAQHVAALNSYDRLSFYRCQRGVMHLWTTCFLTWSRWMDKCVEILVTAGGWLEEKFKRWPHCRQNNYTLSSSLIWSWDQHLVSKRWTRGFWEMNHSSSSASVWDHKLLFKQNHKF